MDLKSSEKIFLPIFVIFVLTFVYMQELLQRFSQPPFNLDTISKATECNYLIPWRQKKL